MRTLLVIIFWIASALITILELELWWDAGERFWVFLAFFSGIGWVIAWAIGVFHLFVANYIIGAIYIAGLGYFMFTESDD